MGIPVVNPIKTGENINNLRIAKGMSVKEIQEIFGFAAPQAIYKWLRGNSMPTIDNLVVLACILGVSIDEIVVTEVVEP